MDKKRRFEKIRDEKPGKIKILMVCHGRIWNSFGETCEINGFMENKGVCYTTTTPFGEEL